MTYAEKETQKVLVSIVVPVHNREKYLRSGLDSLVGQTLKEIEIICVDDLSTDSSPEILKEYSERDERVRVITHETNLMVHMARINGVRATRGEYVCFMDDDDYFDPQSMEKLYSLAKKENVDILHFNTEIVDEGGNSSEAIANMSRWLEPFEGRLSGSEILTNCFIEDGHHFTMWNKIYKGDFCRQAFSKLEYLPVPYQDDLYEYLVLAHGANTYLGVKELSLYYYRLGYGISTAKSVSIQTFQRIEGANLADKLTKNYIRKYDIEENCPGITEKLHNFTMNTVLSRWPNTLYGPEKAQGFDILMEDMDVTEVLSWYARRNWFDGSMIGKAVTNSQFMKEKPGKVQVIGIFYERLGIGGLERVLTELAGLWQNMGYRCIVFTDLPQEELEYVLPEGVVHITSGILARNGEAWSYRAAIWKENIEKYNIDTMVYHSMMGGSVYWDLLLLRGLGVKTLVYCHSNYSAALNIGLLEWGDREAVFGLTNGIITLSKTDRTYWKKFHPSVFTVQNPMGYLDEQAEVSALHGRNVLWIGRFSAEKCPEHAIEIMADVIRRVPDATLTMVGDDEGHVYMQRLKELAMERHIDNNVIFTGYTMDVKQYYLKSDLLLATSVFEGYNMTMLEAQYYGLPCVMYDLPYLTICEGYRGIIPVEPGNREEAAERVTAILMDEDKRRTLGRQARLHALELSEYDFAGRWKEIFDSLEKPIERAEGAEDEALLWETLFNGYKNGMRGICEDRARLQAELNAVTGTRSYRLGRAITKLPRKLREVVNNKSKK